MAQLPFKGREPASREQGGGEGVSFNGTTDSLILVQLNKYVDKRIKDLKEYLLGGMGGTGDVASIGQWYQAYIHALRSYEDVKAEVDRLVRLNHLEFHTEE